MWTQEEFCVVYSRPSGHFEREDAELEALRWSYEPRLHFWSLSPAEASERCGTFVSPSQASLLVVHEGRVTSGLMGHFSHRDADCLIRDALHRCA